ncbi:MAG: YceI family protein [Candidatus Omnitrophica bacterium]|nr:YceI family protein [Candidatus Omnitrophota bacterium]
MRIILNQLMIIIFLLCLSASLAFADSRYVFTCDDSEIKSSIKYSVLGKYNSDFQECQGTIIYDELKKLIKFVRIEIEVKSIQSSCGWCDDIVKSRRILDSEQYPLIVFESTDFNNDSESYWATGTIDMHGVSQKLYLPFHLQEKNSSELFLKGTWVLRRKDFKVTWNKLLDHGGLMVGDHFTVDWAVLAKKL